MSFPESFSPRGGTAASGPDPLPGAFTGQARDLPAPFEFPPVPAVQLLAFRPTITTLPGADHMTQEAGMDLMEPELPMVPAETAFRLKELASALARPVAAPAVVPAAPESADFSLTALAHQLQTRFSQADPAGGEGVDLLAEPAVAAPVPAVGPTSVKALNPAPAVAHPAKENVTGLAALLPAPDLKPAPAAAALGLLEKPPTQPVPKPAITRQGDVFFMEQAATFPESEKPGASDNIELPGDATFPGANKDLIDPMDLMDAPDLLEEAPPFQQRRAEPFLPPPLPAPTAPERPGTPGEDALGLILGGAALILLGTYFACLLPAAWLTLEGANAWARQKTVATLVLLAAAALTALVLGTGSVRSRRWAPPLIHAAGWVAALTVSGIIAVTGFHLVNAEADAAVPSVASLCWMLAALLLPLGFIFYYQQESTTAACEATDPAPCWTDGLPVPALMVFLTGLTLAAGAAAMLCHQPAFPLATETALTGNAAIAAWIAGGALGLTTALLVRLKHAAALWLLLLTALALAATLSPAALPAGAAWEGFLTALGQPASGDIFAPANPCPGLVPLLAALIPAPLLLIFAMARRAFSSPPPP